MATKPSSVDLLKAAAYHKAHAPALTQQQIAERGPLGGQVQVSWLLAQDRERRVLREVFQVAEKVSEDDRRQVGNSFFEKQEEPQDALIRRLGNSSIRRRRSSSALLRSGVLSLNAETQNPAVVVFTAEPEN